MHLPSAKLNAAQFWKHIGCSECIDLLRVVPESTNHLQQVQEMFDAEQRQSWTLTYGQDHMMSSLALGSWALAALGFPDQAHVWRRNAILEAEKAQHYFSQAYARAIGLIALYFLDEVELMRKSAQETIAFSTEQGFPFYATQAQIFDGWALTRCGISKSG